MRLDRDNLAWREINGTLIFLDIAADRYFRLSDEENHKMLSTIGDLGLGSWHQPEQFPCPAQWIPPVKASSAIESGAFQLSAVARALWVQRRIERRLASQSLASVLGDMQKLCNARIAAGHVCSQAAARTIRAFEHARLLRSAADHCLPRSIALVLCLATRGIHARLVIGVKLAQFGAHSWAQAGDVILNDSAEEVLRHRPILII